MDVFQGLITKLVRCKSIERAIAPVASQVSLLIIILEQGDEASKTVQTITDPEQGIVEPCLSVSVCAQRLVEAVNGFISAGERQSQVFRDQEFIDQMADSCEMLTLASDNLFIQAQRYESRQRSENSKSVLSQAVKDVLQGVLKILLVKDDYYVQQLLGKVDSLWNFIQTVERVQEKSDLISTFKAITFAVLALKMELGKRCQNLRSRSCRDEIMVWLCVLQNSIPSLSKASQTFLKYRTSSSAQASRESVMLEINEACKKIKHLLQAGPEDKVEDDMISFVAAVDKVIENLSEVNRGSLNQDTESDIVFLVHHSLSVAHYAWGIYRELIAASCHRILQSTFRLLELNLALKEKPALVEMRSEFESVCETILDEVCDLEKHVNMTLLQLIIETFLCPLERLARLKDIAEYKGKDRHHIGFQDSSVAEFCQYTESICQVALLVAVSSTDSTKVREIIASVRCLESLDLDIAPAVVLLGNQPKDQAAKKRLDLLLGRWAQEVGTIIDAVDSLVDPKVFLQMSENVLTHEVEIFKILHGAPHSDIHKHFSRFVNLSERPAILAKKLLDENSDPVYRNGLNYFITVLSQRISEARNVYKEIMQTKHPPSQQYDTLERRMKLVLQAVKMLKEGLDGSHHPHLLSVKRILFKQRALQPMTAEKPSHKGKKVREKVELVKKSLEETHPKEVSKALEDPTPLRHASTDLSLLIPPMETQKTEVEVARVTLPELLDEKELERGASKEIYMVVKELLNGIVHRDDKVVERMTHNLLSWTNHIAENAEKLLTYCSQIPKVNELKSLLPKLKHITPEITQKSKFIIAGDRDAVPDLHKDAVEWLKVANTARMIIDVTTDRWHVLTKDIRCAIERNNEHELRNLINAVTLAQTDMCLQLESIQYLSGKHIQQGGQRIELLGDVHKELENLTFTINTFVDVATVSASITADDWWQLAIVCRDWSVAVSCAFHELDIISDQMELVGRERFPVLQLKAAQRSSQRISVLEAETNSILELVDCVVVGDSTMKARSDELVASLHSALSDIQTISRLPANTVCTSLDDIFSRLRLSIAMSRWIEKAIDVQDMVRNNCYEYFGFTHQILLGAQEVSLNEDLQDDVKIKLRHDMSSNFLETSQRLKQNVLRAITLETNLPLRTVVRSTLDTLSSLTSQIEGVVRSSSKLSDADVSSLSEQWAARMKKLVYNLKRMEGVKVSVVGEIERLNKATFDLYQHQRPPERKVHLGSYGQQQQQQHMRLEHHHHLQQQFMHQNENTALHQHQLPVGYKQHEKIGRSGHGQVQDIKQMPRGVYTSPSVPEKNHENSLVPHSGTQSRHAESDLNITSPNGSSVQVVLDDAKYLRHRLTKWQENESHFETVQGSKVILSALEMTHLCSEIALFTRGQGSLKDSQEVINAAVIVVRNSSDLEDFGRTLLSLAGNDRCADSLEACVNKMNTCASQLHIISTVLHNSARSYQGDHILMRNTMNLLMAARQMFSVAETLAAKGVGEIAQSNVVSKDVVSLLRKIQSDNYKYIRNERRNAETDSLGLRRVEHHDPPTLTSLVEFKSNE